MGLTGLGKVVSQIIRQIGKAMRWIGDKIMHYMRVGVHYLVMYGRLFARYFMEMLKMMQRDPIGFIQFAGSVAILVYYGLF